MTLPAGTPDLGFQAGDHVCAFYNSSSSSAVDDIVVDYLARGLQDGHKCFGMVDEPAAVRQRIPRELVARDGMLRTHPRIYVNGLIITNPHYLPADQLPG